METEDCETKELQSEIQTAHYFLQAWPQTRWSPVTLLTTTATFSKTDTEGDGDFLALGLGSCCFPYSTQTAMAVEKEAVVSQNRQNKVKHAPKLCFQNHQYWSKGLYSEHALHYHSKKSLKCKKKTHYYMNTCWAPHFEMSPKHLTVAT